MHHALVVQVVNYSQLRVIHNNGENVVEEVQYYEPVDITVLSYPCCYSPMEAIERARNRIGDGYNVITNNCELILLHGQRQEKEQVCKQIEL